MESGPNKNQEIERRFLLWAVPDVEYDSVRQIRQFYKEGVPERIRSEVIFLPPFVDGEGEISRVLCEKTIKTAVPGEEGMHEDNVMLNLHEFIQMRNGFPNEIRKFRHIKMDGELKWEVDDFSCGGNEKQRLVIAEIEIPSMAHKIAIPEWLLSFVIKEITGEKEFSNFALSKIIKYTK